MKTQILSSDPLIATVMFIAVVKVILLRGQCIIGFAYRILTLQTATPPGRSVKLILRLLYSFIFSLSHEKHLPL